MKSYGKTNFGISQVSFDQSSENFVSRIMTPVNQVEGDSGDVSLVNFWESPMHFSISDNTVSSNASIDTLNDAFRHQQAVEIIYNQKNEIVEVNSPDKNIYGQYLSWLTKSSKSEGGETIIREDLKDNIDSKEKLDEIFDFCMGQSCLDFRNEIDVCIPFHYKEDGCYARAHKMRYIIEKLFGYKSVKLFSYANDEPRKPSKEFILAVTSKEACIPWWYHVAPLVSVELNDSIHEFIIDPSLANTSLTISEWLDLQDSPCSDISRVGSTERRESEIYFPGGLTDDDYTHTNSILREYNNGGTA